VAAQSLFDIDSLIVTDALQADVEHGEVFTRRWVVEAILDLVGYTADKDLAAALIVEPACGHGAFVGPIVERLAASCRAHGRSLSDASESLAAFDLLDHNIDASRVLAVDTLAAHGCDLPEAGRLAENWINRGDFLLRHHDRSADYVVGNPPYIRLEHVPEARMNAYRSACRTMGGRADIYIGFFELGLAMLSPGGALGFICADRWMRNQYGKRLRDLVTESYDVEAVISMHDVDAFQARPPFSSATP
jgi:type I restriction-modification system DNA methylase subunit